MENSCLQNNEWHKELSNREKEILTLIAMGKTSSKIAIELSISIRTVEWHRNNIREKLKLDCASQLVICAVAFSNIEMNNLREKG